MNVQTIMAYLDASIKLASDSSNMYDDNIQPSARKIIYDGQAIVNAIRMLKIAIDAEENVVDKQQ